MYEEQEGTRNIAVKRRRRGQNFTFLFVLALGIALFALGIKIPELAYDLVHGDSDTVQSHGLGDAGIQELAGGVEIKHKNRGERIAEAHANIWNGNYRALLRGDGEDEFMDTDDECFIDGRWFRIDSTEAFMVSVDESGFVLDSNDNAMSFVLQGDGSLFMDGAGREDGAQMLLIPVR